MTGSDWYTILETVGPLPKNARLARARRELAKCLRSYPGMRRDRARLRAAQARWRRIDKLATNLYAMLAEEWEQKRWRYNPLIDDAFKRYLLRATKVITETLAMQLRLRKGKLDPSRDWLYSSLLEIWTRHFRGELSVSKTKSGGPCVRFLRATTTLVLPSDELQSVSTLRRLIGIMRREGAIGVFRISPAILEVLKKRRRRRSRRSAGGDQSRHKK